MKPFLIRPLMLSFTFLFTLLIISASPVTAADGKKWDGKTYPFKLLNPAKPNSESNPFIIDTAGKLAYFSWLASRGNDMDMDLAEFGRANGLKGLKSAFSDNYVKLTADLDMNGSKFEFVGIMGMNVYFDGGGHVIDNLRISDKKTKPVMDDVDGIVEMHLGLFQSAESIKNVTVGKRSTITFFGGSKYTMSVFAGGVASNAHIIDNCISSATIKIKGEGDTVVGGIVADSAHLTNSSHRGSIIIEGKVIDSVAKNKRRKIEPGSLLVGGVFARIEQNAVNDGNVSGCWNSGSITVKSSGAMLRIGGVGAEHGRDLWSNLYNTGSIRLIADGDITNAYIGGVLGYGVTYVGTGRVREDGYRESGYFYNKGIVEASVKSGKKISAGGITGGGEPGFNGTWYSLGGGITGCINTYNSGPVSVSSTGKVDSLSAGGIGGSGCMVFNSYNTGRISGTSAAGTALNAGGLGGESVYVQNSYSTGAVIVKGSGTNLAGGLVGNTRAYWGETEKTKLSSLNGFWLNQPKAGGINSNIKYGMGSYSYYLEKDRESPLAKLSFVDKKKPDPGRMVERSYGDVYSFGAPGAKVMKRSDDTPGKRPDLNGTLLDNLNKMAEEKKDRLYRKWVIDGNNGGYPVLSSKPTVFVKASFQPDAAAVKKIAGVYQGVHNQWIDKVILERNGTFRRGSSGECGIWSYDGKVLTLKWEKWPPEILDEVSPGVFSCRTAKFTLTLSSR